MGPRLIRPVLLGALATLASATLAEPYIATGERARRADPLLAGFRAPPESARPRVWWHWLSGNVSKDGISKDLEWMKRIGIAGAMMFDGDMGSPQIVPERINVLSPSWYDHLRFAAAEADRLGLEFTMAAAPGWSETGGPWVHAEMGMKRFVWSETRVSGGRRPGKLAILPANAGPFQAISRQDFMGNPLIGGPAVSRDVAVLAFRAPDGEIPLSALTPIITSSAAKADLAALVDGNLEKRVTLPSPAPERPLWVRFDFRDPVVLRALTYVGPLGGRFSDGPSGRIEASSDGRSWRVLRTLTGQAHRPAPQRTFAFPATAASHFRVTFDRPATSREPVASQGGFMLAELAPVPGARVDLFEDRAGFGVLMQTDAIDTPPVAHEAAIASAGILDLTDRLRSDGTLDWTAPEGDWIVLRAGWSLTGEVNHPATPDGTGLEVDKLNAKHVRTHLESYLGPVLSKLSDLSGNRGLGYLLTDSWEAGQANWTEAMPAEFARRRGYDLIRMLPVLAGHVVDSSERSDAFLWDFRRTIADLVAENHYGTIARFAKDHHLGYYGEATGVAWPTVADGMLAKSRTDIPMGEFWAMPFDAKPTAFQHIRSDEFPADIIETRSASHIYGKSLVAAEAFTSSQPQWTSTPWKLKWVADKYMAMGVNRLVIHASPHQPDDKHRPGLALGPFGQAFTRHETWGEMARPWIDYLSRSSFLLQQGAPVADVLYFYGEGAPSGVPYDIEGEPADPRRWGFDYVNADALQKLARSAGGRIEFPGGASYKLLVLPRGSRRMTLPLITRIAELVAAGAVIMGPKPVGSPSLSDDSAAVSRIADQLWGVADGQSRTVHQFGKGRVYWQEDVEEVLATENIGPDLETLTAEPLMDIRFAHRRLPDGELYFVTNQSGIAATTPVRFRTVGRTPEAWDAADGSVRSLSYRIVDGRTEVPITLRPYEAVFIMFRARPGRRSLDPPKPAEWTMAELSDGWTLEIPAVADKPISFATSIGSWTANPLPEVRYFSGVATYRRVLDIPRSSFPGGGRLYLDLGSVGDVAEVRVNGAIVGTAWKPPYRVEITNCARVGRNQLEVRVANSWQNRLVGDRQPDATGQAWTEPSHGPLFAYLGSTLAASTPLTPSGLLAPVRLIGTSGAAP